MFTNVHISRLVSAARLSLLQLWDWFIYLLPQGSATRCHKSALVIYIVQKKVLDFGNPEGVAMSEWSGGPVPVVENILTQNIHDLSC